MEDCSTVTFCQCMRGALAMKPTTLGLVRFPELKARLQSLPYQSMCHKIGRVNACGREHVVLQGTDSMGNFITAPFKQYPCDFNYDIAISAVQCWQRLDFHADLDEETFTHVASQFFVPLDPYSEQHSIGAFGSDLAQRRDARRKNHTLPINISALQSNCTVAAPCCLSEAHIDALSCRDSAVVLAATSHASNMQPSDVLSSAAHPVHPVSSPSGGDGFGDDYDVFGFGQDLDSSDGTQHLDDTSCMHITEDQRERIEDNRALALLRRASKRSASEPATIVYNPAPSNSDMRTRRMEYLDAAQRRHDYPS